MPARPSATASRVRRLREGMLVRLHPDADLSQYSLSWTPRTNQAFIVTYARRDGACNFREAFDQFGNYNPAHRHSVRVMVLGSDDTYCDRMFQRIRLPNCKHICAPHCVCLATVLQSQGLTLFQGNARARGSRVGRSRNY